MAPTFPTTAYWMPSVLLAAVVTCSSSVGACGGEASGTNDRAATADSSTSSDGSNANDAFSKLDAAGDADPASCMILASNYDQSCTLDTDCTIVTSGDYCISYPRCGGSAINVGALAKFNEDVSKTPYETGAVGFAGGTCGFLGYPCCLDGTCGADRQCNSFADAGDDAASADSSDSSDSANGIGANTDAAFPLGSCPEMSNATTGFNGQSCSNYVLCVLNVDIWCCDCGFYPGGSPNCSAGVTAEAPCEPGDAASCMTCDGMGNTPGGGAIYVCGEFGLYGVDAGPQWQGIGTGEACQWTR